MATYTKAILSGSTDGRAIAIEQTATAGTLIHTGPSASGIFDEIYLYAKNESSATGAQVLTILWGADTAPDDRTRVTIPQRSGEHLIIPGLIIEGNATPLTIRALTDLSASLAVKGYVNRIDQT